MSAVLSEHPVERLAARFGKPTVTDGIRQLLDEKRTAILAGEAPAPFSLAEVEALILQNSDPQLRAVINATGVILHTNLGRATLAKEAADAVRAVLESYSNTELGLDSGKRADRHSHVSSLLTSLVGGEDAAVVNNCAGAVLLMLAALCRETEVIVARGELVEIGGGFRIPDVMVQSGAALVEVGTTNKVYLEDYRQAVSEKTSAFLRVHRSNFALLGFTHEPTLTELHRAARDSNALLLVDVGSGLIADPRDLGTARHELEHELRPQEALAAGADLVCFSGDKLLGGPQAGILVGKRDLIAKVKRHPLARALRTDKLTLAALEATLNLYKNGHARSIPTIRRLAEDKNAVRTRAEMLRRRLEAAGFSQVDIKPATSVPGGGALPLAKLDTFVVTLGDPGPAAESQRDALLRSDPPVIGRIIEDQFSLDLRTVDDDDLETLAQTVVQNSPKAGINR